MGATENPFYEITLLRHGESVGNAEARWQGQADYPLTDTGREQAHALAARWLSEGATFELAITSPLSRAKETAEIISTAMELAVETDPLWLERNIGEAAGLTARELRQRIPRRDFINPFDSIGDDHGEGNWALFLRAGQALHSLLRREPGRYLVISHGGILNQVMHAIVGVTPQADSSGLRFRFYNTGFARVSYFPHVHRWQIDTVNDRTHWKVAAG